MRNGRFGAVHITATALLLFFYILRTGLVSLSAYSLFSLPIIFGLSITAIAIHYVRGRNYKIELCYIYLLFFMLFVLLCSKIAPKTVDAEYASGYFKQLLMLSVAYGTFSYLSTASRGDKVFLGRSYLLFTIITAIYTCYAATVGPFGIIRNTAFGEYDNSFHFVYGGYDFIYLLVVLYAVILTFYQQQKKLLRTSIRVFIISILVFFAYTIVISGFSTAFVLICIFTIWNVFTNKWIRILALIAAIVMLFLFPWMITGIIDRLSFIPKMTVGRVKELIISLSGSSRLTYLSGEGERGERILRSLRVFFEHPLLGGFIGNSTESVGGHSELIDTLGRFGLVAYSCFIGFWVDSYKRIVHCKTVSRTSRTCVRSAMFMILVLSVFDTISLTNTIVPIFVFAPFCEEILGSLNRKGTISIEEAKI